MQQLPTLLEVVQSRKSVTGYEMEQIVKTAVNSLDDEEAYIAEILEAKYFGGDVANNYKPLKFVHYRVLKSKDGEYTMRRNLYMSPRATEYFSKEDVTNDELREIVRTKSPVLGSELKRIVDETISREYCFPYKGSAPEEVAEISFSNLSKQLAEYINSYFINCEKPIRDDIWYCISCKEYATATVYRDLNKSPRQQYNKN